MKKCSTCEQVKDEGSFGKSSRAKDGFCRECKKCAALRTRSWRAKNPEKAKAISKRCHERKCRFKIALQSSRRAARAGEYEPCRATVKELKVAWTGRCAICEVPELELNKKLVLDHCHRTGQMRGFICRRCNSGLGHFMDDEGLLINAIHYLMNPIQKE